MVMLIIIVRDTLKSISSLSANGSPLGTYVNPRSGRALFVPLGLQFAPHLRDLGDQRLPFQHFFSPAHLCIMLMAYARTKREATAPYVITR